MTTDNAHVFYWIGFLLYAITVIFIGWRGRRRQKEPAAESDAFWSAGRTLNAGSVGLSISASFMSISWSCVYAVQLFYWYGASALWLVPIPWLLTMLGIYLLVPHFRRLPAFSQPEMIAWRFGARTRAFIALPLAFVFLVWGGAEIYAAARLLAPLLDVPFQLVLPLIALVVAIYSTLGGFSAVVATDRLQFALVALFVFAIAAIALTVLQAAAPLKNIIAAMPAPAKSHASAWALFAAGPALIGLTFIAYLPGWLVETDIWLRVQAARTTRAARQGVFIAGVNSLLFLILLPMIIGLSALYLYPPLAGEIPARLRDGEAIIAVLMQDHVPVWLNTVLSVGLAAAAMSTIDTCANVLALSLSYDMLEPVLQARSSRMDPGKLARIMAAVSVLFAYLYAVFTESLWDIFYLSSGVLTTTIALPMLAIFRAKATARQVRSAALTGFSATLLFYFLENRGVLTGLEPEWLAATGLGYILWGLAASGASYWLMGRFRAK